MVFKFCGTKATMSVSMWIKKDETQWVIPWWSSMV